MKKSQHNIFVRFGAGFWKHRAAYMFLAPLLIGITVFSYYPPAYGLMLSFFKKSSGSPMEFIGLGNFKELFRDPVFLNSIPTMFKIMIPRLIISIFVPLIAAELVFSVRRLKLQSAYRVIMLLPIVAPGIVGMLIWRNLLSAEGLLTTVVKGLSLAAPDRVLDWLNDPSTVIFAIIFMGFPWIGGTAVLIYLSGLMNVPEQVFEASRLDGCTGIKRFFYIDLPFLAGQIRYFLIFGIIGGLQDYGTQVVLTQGGPGWATYVPGYYMYVKGYVHDEAGYAAAIGSVLFVAIMAVTAVAFRFVNMPGFNRKVGKDF